MTAGRKPAKPKSTPKQGTKRATSDREDAFLQHYLADPERNGTKAAIAAGYAESGARVQAHRLLTRANIRDVVSKSDAKSVARVEQVMERAALSKERAAEMLATMALADIRDIVEFGPEHRSLTLMDGSVVKTSGVGIKASDQISDFAAMGIQEVSEGPNGIKVKLYDRRAALMDLAKLQGWIVEKGPLEVPALDRLTDLIRSLTQRSALPVGPRALRSPSQGTD